MELSFTDRGMLVGGESLPLYSGAFHYWRVERRHWAGILRKIREMGFGFVETYVPWSVHERERGLFDFGEIDGNKDLPAFLSLCAEEGLKVLLRPGPHINAELSLFGYPDRIVYDEEIQARSPWGTPVMLNIVLKQFPLPSYASEKLFAETRLFFAALAPILRRYTAPAGPVCGLQLDNETCYFFKDQAYVMDYCDDAVDQYRRMLSAKYGEISALNRAYRASYGGFGDVVPPVRYEGERPEDLPYYLDWAEYKEFQINEALGRLGRMWRDLGVELPFFHNIQSQDYTPIDLAAMEKSCVDVAGIDMYPEPKTYKLVRDRARYMSGMSRFPFIPEFGCGSWYERRKTLTPDEEEFVTLYAFMNGVRGINYYMLVERDRWQGSPLSSDGRTRPAYFELYKSINAFLAKSRLWNFRRSPKVLLVKNYEKGRYDSIYSRGDYGELSCNEAIRIPDPPWKLFVPAGPPPFPDLMQASYGKDDQIEYGTNHWGKEALLQELAARLSALGIDYDIADTHAPLERLSAYGLVVCCTYDFMDRAEAEKLVSCSRGGAKVLIGPTVPRLDREMFPLDSLSGEIARPGSNLSAMGGVDDAVAAAMPHRLEYRAEAPEVELAVLGDGTREILFAANVGSRKAAFRIAGLEGKRIETLWGASKGAGNDPASVRMPGYSVFAWEVTKP